MRSHWLFTLALAAGAASLGPNAMAQGTMKAPENIAQLTKSADASTTAPKVGEKAKDFSLQTLDHKDVKLSELVKTGPVVLVELRGWVGYQCPVCTQQVGELIAHQADLKATGAHVVLIYPGAPELVDDKAKEFINGKNKPEDFTFVVDPSLKFTNAWGLRWNARGENSYPATFVIDQKQVVRFAKVSHTHGGRASSQEILGALKKLK